MLFIASAVRGRIKYVNILQMLGNIVKCSMSSFILMSSRMGSFACYPELNLFGKVFIETCMGI